MWFIVLILVVIGYGIGRVHAAYDGVVQKSIVGWLIRNGWM